MQYKKVENLCIIARYFGLCLSRFGVGLEERDKMGQKKTMRAK